MLKNYIETVKRLSTDKDGVVSFEYVIVAACIVGAVAAAFGTGATGAIATALTDGITAIGTASLPPLRRSDSQRGHWDVPMPPPFLRHAFDELDCSHSFVSGNTIVAICCNDRYRDTIDPK